MYMVEVNEGVFEINILEGIFVMVVFSCLVILKWLVVIGIFM